MSSENENNCVGENVELCEQNICSFKANRLINLVNTGKLVYEAIHNDIADYIFELASLQEYFGQSDLNDDDMFNSMVNWYDTLTLVLYTRIKNHLSTTTAVEGHGKHVIKKWINEDGERKTTHKYQNVCERQIEQPGCEDHLNHRVPNKYYGKGDTYLIQYSKSVVTYDNMIINLIFAVPTDQDAAEASGALVFDHDGVATNDDQMIVGLQVNIGDHGVFTINNGTQLKLDTDDDNPDSDQVQDFYVKVDTQMQNLAGLQRIIQNNVDFIERYVNRFTEKHANSC